MLQRSQWSGSNIPIRPRDNEASNQVSLDRRTAAPPHPQAKSLSHQHHPCAVCGVNTRKANNEVCSLTCLDALNAQRNPDLWAELQQVSNGQSPISPTSTIEHSGLQHGHQFFPPEDAITRPGAYPKPHLGRGPPLHLERDVSRLQSGYTGPYFSPVNTGNYNHSNDRQLGRDKADSSFEDDPSEWVDPTKICLVCQEKEMDPRLKFCSLDCINLIAADGSMLLRVPEDHELFEEATEYIDQTAHVVVYKVMCAQWTWKAYREYRERLEDRGVFTNISSEWLDVKPCKSWRDTLATQLDFCDQASCKLCQLVTSNSNDEFQTTYVTPQIKQHGRNRIAISCLAVPGEVYSAESVRSRLMKDIRPPRGFDSVLAETIRGEPYSRMRTEAILPSYIVMFR